MSKFSWGKTSLDNLSQAHTVLQALANKALEISNQDMKVICGYRNEADQNKAYAEGKSKLMWPKSLHNSHPSLAIDVVPLPLNWNDTIAFKEMVVTFKMAWNLLDKSLTNGWALECGAEFSFRDYPHFQIKRISK